MFNKRRERGDQIIAFAVMIQSLLLIMQIVLMNVFHMSGDATTIYRVLLTAFPMVLAMIVSANRNLSRFILTFLIAILLLVITIAVFPKNEPYVVGEGLRFFLPVVVPSFLCLTTVSDYKIVERTLYVISWFTAILVLFYFVEYFRGVFSIEGYNMPFSYACLLPMVSFYSHRKTYDYLVVLVMLMAVLAIGARGPAVYFVVYVIIDMLLNRRKWRFAVLILAIVLIIALPTIYSFFSASGISSRTLRMLLEGDFVQDSGRNAIQAYFWSQLMENPIIGLGLFGDRLKDDVVYCHNLFLEILVDFGVLLGSIIIITGVISLIKLFIESESENKNRIIKYFCALILPFLTSSSYLIDSEFAIFVGLCVLLHKDNLYKRNVFTSRKSH